MNRLTFSRLSDLIRICYLREDGYNKAYDSFSYSPIAFIFKKYANESRLYYYDLERYITKYATSHGEENEQFVEYKWSKMIGQLRKQNVHRTIQECVDCETRTISFYKAFLADYLSEELKTKISKQLIEIEKSLIILQKFNNSEVMVEATGLQN